MGQSHLAPAKGADKSVQDCPARQDIKAQPSASFSQIIPSYAAIGKIKILHAHKVISIPGGQSQFKTINGNSRSSTPSSVQFPPFIQPQS